MNTLNSGTLPTRERTEEEMNETGRRNMMLVATSSARQEVRTSLAKATNNHATTVDNLKYLSTERVREVVSLLAEQGVENSGMFLSPEDKRQVVNAVLNEVFFQM